MREALKDRARLEHILEAIDNVSSYTDGQTLTSLENDKMRYYAVVKKLLPNISPNCLGIINHDLTPLRSQVVRYIEETDWVEWEKNVEAVVESAVHKSLVQTARRMKSSGYEVDEIINITGLTMDEIDEL